MYLIRSICTRQLVRSRRVVYVSCDRIVFTVSNVLRIPNKIERHDKVVFPRTLTDPRDDKYLPDA
jgi:hypothetical protein